MTAGEEQLLTAYLLSTGEIEEAGHFTGWYAAIRNGSAGGRSSTKRCWPWPGPGGAASTRVTWPPRNRRKRRGCPARGVIIMSRRTAGIGSPSGQSRTLPLPP